MKVVLLIALACMCYLPRGMAAVERQGVLVVAADGSGDVRTVGEAIARVPEDNRQPFLIRLKPGIYREQIVVPSSKPYITLQGASRHPRDIVLTFNLSNKDTGSTSASFSTYIGGHDFRAANVTFENSYGVGSQAVAVMVEADRAVFDNCRFLGWQDTLYAKQGRQFYLNCYIEGHVDFIFGQAAAVFENCRIHSKADGYIAAPMRFSETEASGYVFNKSKLTGDNIKRGVYLARPWRAYGRAVFIETAMDAHIKPEGWHNWNDAHREQTAFFAEYKSTGKGANPHRRVKWARHLTAPQAADFATLAFLKGTDGWNPYLSLSTRSQARPPLYKPVAWSDALKQPSAWYATDEATRIADNLLAHQRANGGWAKNTDLTEVLTHAQRSAVEREKSKTDTTIDNGTTYTQLRYLAKVITAKNIARHVESFNKGLDFLFAAQYANGGYPQYFPLRSNYSRHITFNDDAMVNVLKLLRDVAKRKPDFVFVDDARRTEAERRLHKGIELILKSQVVTNNTKTVWAAQHDAVTLAPTGARTFEPPSLASSESAEIVELLMDIKPSSANIVEAVESAIKWFEITRLDGIRWIETRDARNQFERRVVKDANAPPVWARFYEIATNRPIFIGRDGIIKYDVMHIEAERRNGYRWYVDKPARVLADYPAWKSKVK